MNYFVLLFQCRDAICDYEHAHQHIGQVLLTYKEMGESDHINDPAVSSLVSGEGRVEGEENWARKTTREICFTLA